MLINLSTQRYPVPEYEVLSQHPDKSFPQDLSKVDWESLGYAYVYLTRPPVVENSLTHGLREVPPTKQDGKYQQTWEVYELPPDTVQANKQKEADTLSAKIKSRRASLLASTDWTQIPGSPLTDPKKQQWAEYRQALRDLPTQEGFPYVVTWPEQP